MDGRTIATHGGGDFVIGGGPPIDGVLHTWYYPGGQRGAGRSYGVMFCHGQVRQLQEALGFRKDAQVRTFNGHVDLRFTGELAHFWFYAYGATTPEQVMRLHESAIDAAIDAIGEVLNPMAPMPVGLHDASLSGNERRRLEALMAPTFQRSAA